ncbi:2-amino-4-hydroxy-6-hydroxymethyldihydropteridine diphosphokinase [Rhodoluna limnophila]|jgi:2-amino-4-hydroxy-6-hydroxymethyldihydropteridine diphosphokinase|uniref:2-amino-4-hydroxy-6- hydroxymethyldihydropteridine diphosphokinase n=1 Tax=Rhodoluna limnophila TaxID=232537 RepID=UPI001105EF0F|nr:2-amino-4-hydroxy-6-hydroxymethyldihydropteridine diphosphokinase [Rhodoluna limnophila]
MAEPVKAILALGGNLGKRRKTIRSALKALAVTPGIKGVLCSPLVESVALTEAGTDETKPNYLNGVVRIETTLKPKELLNEIRRIETEHGRIRLERWGSRTLDIDIITYGNEIKVGKELTLPHPRASERAFVLVPWSLLEPDAVLPGYGSVKELAEPIKDQVWLVR